MKQNFLLLAGALIAVFWLMSSCSDEGVNGPNTNEENHETLAALISSEVERFHRLGLEELVEEMSLYPGSDLLNNEFEQVMDQVLLKVNEFAYVFDWEFDVDQDDIQISSEDASLFTELFQQDPMGWFSHPITKNKTASDSEDDLIDFEKIEYFANLIGEVVSMTPKHQCVDTHLDLLRKEVKTLSEKAQQQLNAHEWFIFDNMATVGLSSFVSWSNISQGWTENFIKDAAMKDEKGDIDWEHIAFLARADLISGGLGCMKESNKLVTASFLGPKAFLAAAGGIFGTYAFFGSVAAYIYSILENEDAPEE